jgi:hypothetical protein
MECSECHSAEAWVPLANRPAFRHEREGFPLEAAHAQVGCRGCHQSLVFRRVGSACADCHADAHDGAFGSRCEACHTPRTFARPLGILEVHDRAHLPLFVRHAAVGCESCHRSQRPAAFASTPTDCAHCHGQTAARVTSPNHGLAGFTQGCERCHSVAARGWKPTSFLHTASFPLRGAHTSAACAGCHAASFTGTPRDCYACHMQDYTATRNPDHVARGFPTRCEGCHQETGWRRGVLGVRAQVAAP